LSSNPSTPSPPPKNHHNHFLPVFCGRMRLGLRHCTHRLSLIFALLFITCAHLRLAW
jgi:hypothetical protein